MDVSLSGRGIFAALLVCAALLPLSCGNRYDLSNERGRRARIDDANYHLSRGECTEAAEAIDPLYTSSYVDDEIRVVKASSTACFAGYNLLRFLANMAGTSNYFQALAKSLDSASGDGARTHMYGASDVLTRSGSVMNASARSKSENTYMVFLQFGVISAVLRNYGGPGSDGTQGPDLVYETADVNPADEMSNTDACALAAAFSFISDSYSLSDLSDSSSQAAVSAINSVCTAAGLASCTALSRDRSACNGTNQNSIDAAAVVTSVNSAW